MNTILKKSKRILLLTILLLSQLVYVSCIFNQDPPNEFLYTFKGETVATFLDKDSQFSSFVTVLNKAKLYDLLSTYGAYTCFAPTNAAIDTFLQQRNFTSVEQLSFEACDTLARTHLIKGFFYTTDLNEGAIPTPNFLDRYLSFSSDTIGNAEHFGYFINKTALMVRMNDSVQNGVVHSLARVITPSNLFLPQLMAKDSTISIFMEALQMTGFADKLQAYIDPTYKIGSDSIDLKLFSGDDRNRRMGYPAKRLFGFTGFVEQNSVYKALGINSPAQLIAKLRAKVPPFNLYDPDGLITYDDNYSDTTNFLYRYVSYHFSARLGNYDDWVAKPFVIKAQAYPDRMDPQDFYETMCPFSMFKFQKTEDGKLYINRRRVNEGAAADRNAPDPKAVAVPGVYVKQASESGSLEQGALNGVYHYIDGIIAYNEKTVTDVLNTRFRFDTSVLSPDFMTSGARGREGPNHQREIKTVFKLGYVTNFTWLNKQSQLALREDPGWSPSMQMNCIDLSGLFDYIIKLPSVPPEQYDIRIGTNVGGRASALQTYVDGAAVGIPIDLDEYKAAPAIGYVDDVEDQQVNDRVDKDMKLRGFMKGPDSWFTGDNHVNTLREPSSLGVRIVIANVAFTDKAYHYIRIKNVRKDNPNGYFPFDYLELCPKSVYASPNGEDRH